MFPRDALELIFRFEPLCQPGNWLGGIHGITIGYGYDLGTKTAHQFVRDWNGLLTATQLGRLLAVVGVCGTRAAEAAPLLKDIEIQAESAQVVWVLTELTQLERAVAAVFPGVEYFPDLARGALVSLVQSRGTRLDGARREEMREIRDEIEKCAKTHGIGYGTRCHIAAHLVRCMKGHFPLPRGVQARLRRDAEAELLERAAKVFMNTNPAPEELMPLQ